MSESEGQEPEESILGSGAAEPAVPVTVGQPTQPAWMPSTMPGASQPSGATPQPAAPPPPPTASTWPTPMPPIFDMPSAPAPQAPDPGGRRRLWAILATVVAGAIALGLVALLVSRKNTEPTSVVLSPRLPVASPAPSPSVIPPVNVTTSVEAFKVTLTWTQVTGGTAVDAYHVYRDGALLGDVAAPTTTYTDTTVVPGKSYTYEIDSSGGGVVSSKIPVEVKTPVPSLSQGRVEGTFNVSLTAVSHSGFSSFNSKFTLGWHFAPKCDTGVCNVVWTDLSEKTIKATLKRSGSKYSGSDSALFNVQCNGTIVTSNLSVSFHVSKAKAIDGAWRASTLVGTFTESNPAQLGCLASSATYSFTATFVS